MVRRVEQLRARIAASARYQEGEEPAEDGSSTSLLDGPSYRTWPHHLRFDQPERHCRQDPDGRLTATLRWRPVSECCLAAIKTGRGCRRRRDHLRTPALVG